MKIDGVVERLQVEYDDLDSTIHNIEGHYRRFYIPKKSGGTRCITAPSPILLTIQRKILRKILQRTPPHSAAKAYVRGRGIRENARFHIGQKMLLKLDISDFFGSLSSSLVNNVFQGCVGDQEDAEVLTALCVLNDRLPQGAATSGCLSNLILRSFDTKIMKAVRCEKLRYTRYADDIAISGDPFDAGLVIEMVSENLADLGLRLNTKKTFVARIEKHRQRVTGIVVNEKLSPGRDFIRDLRKDVHFALKWGLSEHAKRAGFAGAKECLQNLQGRVAFAHQVLTDKGAVDTWRLQLDLISKRHELKRLQEAVGV